MKEDTHVQPTGLAYVLKSRMSLRTRIALGLAGMGMAVTLLAGGLAGVSPASMSITAIARSLAFQSSADVRSLNVTDNSSGYSGSAGSVSAPDDESYQSIAMDAAVKAGISVRYFLNQIQQESGFNPGAVSPAGAEGIAQFMPATAASMGVNPWNHRSALYGAASLMASLNAQFGGNYAMALAAYNAGSGAVQAAISEGGNDWYAYLPAETQNYILVIMR
jgi:soluble lytic murein transglycosylase-like protein